MAQIRVIKISSGKLREHNNADDITLNSFTVTGGAASLSASGLGISTATIAISGGNLVVTDAVHTSDVIVGATATQTLSNKSLVDASTRVVDNSDPSIAIELNAGGSTGTTLTLQSAQTVNRTLSLPDATDTIVARATTDTLTNKTISGASNTFSNIPNSATTATSANTPSAIVARDGSGNFAAGKVTVANGTGNGLDVDSPGVLEIGVSVGPNNLLLGSVTSTVVVQGDLTVQGTTTSVNSTNLEVTDKNITVNNGGNDAASEGAGLTVERTGTAGSIIYAAASATRFKAGDLGGEVDIVGTSSTQTLTNKTLAAGSNSITSTASRAAAFDGSGNLGASSVTSTELGQLSGIGSAAVGISDSQTLTNKTIAAASNSITATSSRAAQFGAGGSLEASSVTATELGQLSGVGSQVDGINDTRTLTNKTLSTSSNDITATASRAAIFDASGNLTNSSVTDTEIGYLSGASSNIQTQINGLSPSNPGDIEDTLFSSANNQASPVDVAGLLFANATVRAARILLSVTVDATADLYEVFDILVIQKGASWALSASSVGDDSGYDFSITNSGQVQYTNGNYAGFVSGDIRFRAQTLVV